LNHCRIVTLA